MKSALCSDGLGRIGHQSAVCAYLTFYFHCNISSPCICCGYSLAHCYRRMQKHEVQHSLEGETSKTTVTQLCPRSGPVASWWQFWERWVSTPLLKSEVRWPQHVGNSVCSTAVPGVSWEESQPAACLICFLIAVLCLYFCPSRQPALGNLVELVLENTLRNILIEASRGEVVLTARPRVIALPPRPSPR